MTTHRSYFDTHDGLQDEELELDPELETAAETPDTEEVVEEETEEVEEVVQEPEREETVPLSRLNAEKARADTLQQVLETLRHQQQPQQQAPVTRPVEDQEANLDPKDKEWRNYIRQAARPLIEQRVQEIVSEIKKSQIDPLQRVSIEVQDRIDEQETKRKFKDYDLVRDKVNQTRAEWYQQFGVVAPREVAYHYVKGQQASKVAATTRTQTVRSNAKAGATVPNKPPAKKVAPKGPVTLNDVAQMSVEDAERWLLKNDAKF